MNRSLLILLGALIILVAIYLVVKSSRDVTYHPETFAKVDTARVDAIRIHTPTDNVVLKKKAGEWEVAQPLTYPADSRMVRDLLGKLSTMELETEEPLSQDPVRDTIYQVGDNGTQVAVAAGTDTVANIIMGKMAPDSRHTYVRKAGKNDIFSVNGIFTSQLNRKVRDWRDRTILDIARDSITRIDLQWPNQSFSLVKADTIWRMEGATVTPFDQPSVEHLAAAFFHFRTLDFVDGDSAKMVDFSKPAFTISVTTGSGKRSFSLQPMPADTNRFYVKRDELESTLFVIYKGTAGVYMKRPEDFKTKPPSETKAMPPPGKPQHPTPEQMQEIMKKMKKQ